MKRILLQIVGYYLIIQAALATLLLCGRPENILLIAALSGWGGYKLIQIADGRNRMKGMKK